MEPLKMAKQMIDFQKATFDNTFNAMVMLQEQTERMVQTLMGQATFLPDEGKKVLNEWVQSFNKGRKEFKKTVDDSFSKVEAYFAETGKKS
jgi:polyhydroxyalkanoate synthesis regulator phasin